MRIPHKKRLVLAAGSVATVGAVSALVVGATFGLFSSGTVTQTNTFTAAKVTLTKTATASCSISTLVPGDKSSGYANIDTASHRPDSHAVHLHSEVHRWRAAYLGLSVTVVGTAGATAPGLYNGTSGTGLKLKVSDTASVTFTLAGLTSATSSTSNLFVSTSPIPSGTSIKFSVNFALPRAMTNKYQGAKTTLKLKVGAVQSGNNHPSTGTCTTAGKQCTAGSAGASEVTMARTNPGDGTAMGREVRHRRALARAVVGGWASAWWPAPWPWR